jgi:hypothetical protein
MATIQGVNQGVQLLLSNPSGAQTTGGRKTFLCTMSFAAATVSDVGSISGLAATIQTRQKNGKTFTITHAAPAYPGTDASGNAVHITGTVTAGVTAGQVDFALGGVTASASAVVAASSGVGLLVTGYET